MNNISGILKNGKVKANTSIKQIFVNTQHEVGCSLNSYKILSNNILKYLLIKSNRKNFYDFYIHRLNKIEKLMQAVDLFMCKNAMPKPIKIIRRWNFMTLNNIKISIQVFFW